MRIDPRNGRECAAGPCLSERRHDSGDRCEHVPRSASRYRSQQPSCVRMRGRAEDLRYRRVFDDASAVHDRDAVGGFRDDAEVVRDQQQRQSERAPQLTQKIQHLGLHGDVERGGGFIGDQQGRICGE